MMRRGYVVEDRYSSHCGLRRLHVGKVSDDNWEKTGHPAVETSKRLSCFSIKPSSTAADEVKHSYHD